MARNLRALRALKGMSQGAIALKVGVDPKTIGRLERAKTTPEYETLSALADLYQQSFDVIGGRADLSGVDSVRASFLIEQEPPDDDATSFDSEAESDRDARPQALEDRVDALSALPTQVQTLSDQVANALSELQSVRTLLRSHGIE